MEKKTKSTKTTKKELIKENRNKVVGGVKKARGEIRMKGGTVFISGDQIKNSHACQTRLAIKEKLCYVALDQDDE